MIYKKSYFIVLLAVIVAWSLQKVQAADMGSVLTVIEDGAGEDQSDDQLSMEDQEVVEMMDILDNMEYLKEDLSFLEEYQVVSENAETGEKYEN